MPSTPRKPGDKPIAVLCDKLQHGFDYLLRRGNVVEYSIHRRELFTASGQWYVFFDSPEQLKSWEIKDFMVAPGFGNHPQYREMMNEVGMRLRRNVK